MTEKKQNTAAGKRLMFTAGATTLAATGAVFGAAVLNTNLSASADQVQDQSTTQSDQNKQWQANSVDQVKAEIQQQGHGQSIKNYSVQWGDTLDVIAEAYGVSTDEAAQQLGLHDDTGLLITGYQLGKQAQVIQTLKDTGVLLSTQSDVQSNQTPSGQPDLITMQKGTPTTDQDQVTADQSQNSQAAVNGQVGSTAPSSQATSQSAAALASQSVADSQSLSVANSQAAASQVQMNVGATRSTSATQWSQFAVQSRKVVTRAASQNVNTNQQVAGSQSADLASQTQSLSQAQVSQAPASQAPASQAQQSTAAAQPVQTASTQDQKVDTEKLINWFYARQGQLTYSMTGSRNGSDGTADCSGSMTEALYEAGASKPAYLYNTDSLHGYLQQNGYQLISTNTPWNAQRGDIVIWGQRGASGGSAGHVQVIVSNDPNARAISVNYATGGQTGTAVKEWNYDAAYDYTAKENGGSLAYYVYRQV